MYFKTRLGDYGGLTNTNESPSNGSSSNGTSGASSKQTSTKTKSKKHFHKKNYGGSIIPVHIGYGYPYNTTYGYRSRYGPPPGYSYRRGNREPRLIYLDRKSNSNGIHVPTLLISLGVLIIFLLVRS